MYIKKTKLTNKHKHKKLMKKMLSHKKTKKNMKSHSKSHSRRHSKSKTKSKSKSNNKYRKNKHRGGFSSSCDIVTVKEPGFKLDALGVASGINIPDARGAIFRPNCSGSKSSQAMVP